MINSVLFVARIALLLLLYIFLFAIMRTGIGLVKGQRKEAHGWQIIIDKGPKELKGVKLRVQGPIVVGRSPGADVVIDDTFVSGKHARFSPVGEDLIIEDMGSTNGTLLNKQPVTRALGLNAGDIVTIGNLTFKVARQ